MQAWKKKQEKAANLVKEARNILDEYEGKELPEDKEKQIDEMMRDAQKLKEEVDREKKLHDMDQYFNEPQYKHPMGTGDARSLDGEGKGSEKKEVKKAAFMKFLVDGKAGLSREEKQLVEDSTGEILVPEEVEAEIYRELPKLTVIRDLATVRQINTNRLRRRSMNEVQMGWGKLETGASLTETTLTPEEEYQYVEDLYGLTKVGEDELDDTDVNLPSFIADSFGRARAQTEDTGFIIGTGHSDEEPEGILNNPDVGRVTGSTGSEISVDDLLDLAYDVAPQYRRNGVYIVNSKTELAMRKLKDSNGQYLWQPSVQAGRPATFNGVPVYNQDDIPTIPAAGSESGTQDVAIFGDIRSGYRILDRQGMTVQRLNELYIESGLVGFRARFRVGGAVIRPSAIRVLEIDEGDETGAIG